MTTAGSIPDPQIDVVQHFLGQLAVPVPVHSFETPIFA